MKEKIAGILSMQRVANYGSFLQAWALKNLMLRSGASEVFFIDIEPGRRLKGANPTPLRKNLKRLFKLFSSIFNGTFSSIMRDRKFYRTMRDRYFEDYHKLLELDKPSPGRYDLAVIGSDQVFNFMENNPWGYTTQLFGDVPQARKVISYAASFGYATYDDVRRFGLSAEITENLNRLAEISVRDDNSYKIVLQLTGRQAFKHLDPVLVYDFSKEIEGLQPDIDNYIVIYSYTGRIADKTEVDAIKGFAARHNKRLVSLLARYDWCDMNIIPETPFHVLAWFKNADYVVADTFHGSIFSIITRRQFCSIIRPTNRNRMESLLGRLELEDRMVGSASEIEPVLDKKIDYDKTGQILKEQRDRTEEYLKSAME